MPWPELPGSMETPGGNCPTSGMQRGSSALISIVGALPPLPSPPGRKKPAEPPDYLLGTRVTEPIRQMIDRALDGATASLEDIAEGRTLSHEEVERQMAKWLDE